MMSKTKTQILELLENNRKIYQSGEYIAGLFNVSRNAIWKAVKDLEKDGYKIEAVTNKGYRLADDCDILSVAGMLPFLADKNAEIHVHDVLESTNKSAKEKALSGAKHGTVIIAEQQTAGKGRYGRSFHSPPGSGLYVSLILHPAQLKFTTPTLITAFAAVSVCEAIEAVSCKKPQIKWVNDVFINGRKICGILTEAVTDFESGGTQWVVVGIGINFTSADFPEELREIAGAVFEGEDKPQVTRNRLCAELINRMASPENQGKMLEKYKQRMFMLGSRISVISAAETYEAVAVDIDESGRLIIRKDNGEILPLSSGEISVKV
jgi:BirA family biotin operon repressor/biotin-[acetyl-CoA-carboxylase] ligase